MTTTPVLWSNSTLVNAVDTPPGDDDQSCPSIVTYAGGYVVVWHDNANNGATNPGYTNVKAQRYDFMGNKVGLVVNVSNVFSNADPRILSGFNTKDDSAAVVSLANGGFAIAFVTPGSSNGDIEYVQYRADGSEQFRRALNLSFDNVYSVRLSATENSDVRISYTAYNNNDNDEASFMRTINSAGILGAAVEILPADAHADIAGAVRLTTGRHAVLVERYQNDSDTLLGDEYSKLSLMFVESDGQTSIGGFFLAENEEEPNYLDHSRVAALANGRVVVAWRDLGATGGFNVAFAIYAYDEGEIARDLMPIASNAVGHQTLHDVVGLADGGFMLAWRDHNTDVSYAQCFDADGDPQGLVANIGSNVQGARLTLLADGRVAVAFQRGNGGTVDFDDDIDVRTYIIDPRSGILNGSNGDDQMTSTPGGSFVFGLGGNDTIRGRDGDDHLNGGSGIDALHGEGGADGLTGEAGDDNLYGGDGDDFLSGGADNDFLNGGEGNDDLYGGGGNDQLFGGAGVADEMFGGTGNDIYYVDAPGDFIQESSASNGGTDFVYSSASIFLVDFLEDAELIGTAAISGRGNGLNNKITGNGAANILGGGDGNDTLNGVGGNDTILGDAGADVLNGGSGWDTLNYKDSTSRVQVDLGMKVVLQGYAQGDSISGFEFVVGSKYNDILVGSTLANRITGGVGRDFLTGGAGNDGFYYTALVDSTLDALGRDTITDFNVNGDWIDLSAIDANGALAGNTGFTFIGSAAFTAAGQINVTQNGVDTLININTTGAAAPNMRIILQGLLTLDSGDFVL